MRRNIVTVDSEASSATASKTMSKNSVGYLVVLRNDQPVGIVTERDLVSKVRAVDKDPSKVRVSEVMPAPLITVDPDATVENAVEIMVKNGIRQLAVV